ncbi:MAG: DUF1636 domain-containing protein [Rhodopseudomonas sp.]|uniref:DUF1636 domain-containing protein n=1 Tax=Rhodopseudomonas sp. TaxID=1078 RepID=UPI0018095EA1|nr:DUF1636 domain-containing protein [Rhodopseudomonas sp.]NVN85980.1 DUF1636 domain-containing protein [Rhodopseudomonas sp.]
MDRDCPDETSTELTPIDPRRDPPAGAVVVSVCTTCKSADGKTIVGPQMIDAIKAGLDAADPGVVVRPVQCLSVCKRPATVAVSSPDGYTFLFGDLETDSGSAALLAFVRSYQQSNYGLVPWRDRAQVLRKGMVARLPPARWSPDDGRAPS